MCADPTRSRLWDADIQKIKLISAAAIDIAEVVKKPKMTGKEKIKISEEENGDTHTLTGRNVVQVGSKRLSGVDGAVMALRVQHWVGAATGWCDSETVSTVTVGGKMLHHLGTNTKRYSNLMRGIRCGRPAMLWGLELRVLMGSFGCL